MNIEELMGLKELLMKQKNEDQCVVISNKRSFLPEDSSLFIKPLYTRKSVILSNINTNRAIEKVEKNIEEVLTNAIKYYGYNSQKIEEIFTMGIILDRDKYEQICEKLRKHSEIDILTKDICDKEILESALSNIIELHPYLLKHYNDEVNENGEFHKIHACADFATYIEFNQFYNKIKELGYKLSIDKENKKQSEFVGNDNPYQKLFWEIMRHSKNSFEQDNKLYTDLVVTADLSQESKKRIKK